MDGGDKEEEHDVPESTDIQNYLNSFNKEIQNSGAGPSSGLTEEVFTGTTYFAAADGTLYSASAGEGDTGQQIAFLSPSSDGTSGLQQILLAVGDGSGLASIDTKGLSFSLPVQVTGQLKTSKQNLVADVSKVANKQKNDASVECGSSKNDGIKIFCDKDVDNGDASDSSSQSNVKPQTIMVVQQPGQETVNQMIPISTGGQAIITGLGSELQMHDQQTLQMVASIAEQAANSGSSAVLNTGSAYQTVTIVPSDTNPGELSYVLFMSPPKESVENGDEDEDEENADLSVYDFPDGEKLQNEFVAVEEEGGIRTIHLSHRRSQIVTQQHMCNYCNYTSSKRYLLSRHMKSHSEERPHKCSVCERGFKTLASLQNHVNTHTGTRPHACKECESCFTTSGELVRHVRYKHTHEKPHHCTECDYASVELSKLKRHMRCHTGERPYQCPHCTYASPDTYKLKRHLRIHTGEKPYVCDICSSRFTQSNSLKAHKLIHSGNKPSFQCQFCPTTCGRKTDLRIHIQKLHSCDKVHRCKRCGKVFQDRYSFKLHNKSHEGEKCFKCDLCPYASITLRHLETHMLIHTDQKPFHCEECDQSFRQKQLLKRHKNIYHNPGYVPPEPKEKNLVCSDCGKAFRHKGNLIRHLAVHDPEATAAEREEAMQIGRPKEPGEIRDGEEDELSDYNEMDYDDDNKQVVVFEVIQLPTSDSSGTGQTLTTLNGQTVTLSGNGSQSFTIIQQAPDDDDDDDDKSDEVTLCELSNVVADISGVPAKIEVKKEVLDFDDDDDDGDHCSQKKWLETDSGCYAEQDGPSKKTSKSPKIIQIVTENKQLPLSPSEDLVIVQDGGETDDGDPKITKRHLEQKEMDRQLLSF